MGSAEKKRINVFLQPDWYDYLKDYCKRHGFNMSVAMTIALMQLKEDDDNNLYVSTREFSDAIEEIREGLREIREVVDGFKQG